jgi:N-acyl homoserine lactone hydrolase
MAIAQRENAFVIYGHDPEQWPQLKKAPEFYG